MQVDVFSLLNKRSQYPFATDKTIDAFIDTELELKPERCCFVCPERIFTKYCKQHGTLDKYYITAVFDLASIFAPYTFVKMSLYVLSNKESKVVKTGVFRGKISDRNICSKDINRTPFMKIPDDITDDFIRYCDLINEWVNKGGITPTDTDFFEFNAISRNCFDTSKPFATSYTKNVFAVKAQLKEEKIVRLDELADIIRPKHQESEMGFTITSKNFKYPFNKNELKAGAKSSTKILKGDILFHDVQNLYYLITGDMEDIYASWNMYIIRPKDGVLPEYLYVYLNSETSKTITESLMVGSCGRRISFRDFSALPVISPPTDMEEYKDIFKALYLADENSVDELTKLITNLKNRGTTLEGVLLTEQYQKLKVIKDPKVRNIILDDIDELKVCFENGAYKACLILAGSILEAFMIDWLSSIDSRDYFNEDYIVFDRRDRSKRKRAELIDYIDAVAEIKKPDWMEEQCKAHHIRDKRNMVHAKLCMKRSRQINEETCKQVIDYLIEIISTRYKNIF